MQEYRNRKTFENIKFGFVLILIAGGVYFLYSVITTILLNLPSSIF